MPDVEPAKLTVEEIDVIGALVRASSTGTFDTQITDAITNLARAAARAEITSLAGLALRRTQDRRYTRNPERNAAIDAVNDEAAEFWGEVLTDFSGHTGGGDEPGDVEEASAK